MNAGANRYDLSRARFRPALKQVETTKKNQTGPKVSEPESLDTSTISNSSIKTLQGLKKPLVSKDKLAKVGLQTAIKQAVVIGGGPAGLAAAITLAKRDVAVTVLELRADENGQKPMHARPHQISLRQDSLNSLKQLGAYNELMKTSGFVEQETTIRKTSEGSDSSVKKPKGVAMSNVSGALFIHPGMLDTDSVTQARISDVEKALYKEAKALGIDIKAGVAAELKPDGDSYSVQAQEAFFADNVLKKRGPIEDLGTPDLVVVADGAGSKTRESLGIGMIEESKSKHYLGGHIQKPLGPHTTKIAHQEANGFNRHIMGTGHSLYDQTWVSVEVTPEEAALDPTARTQLLADQAQHVFADEKIGVEDVGWGAGQLTTVQNRRAERTTAGDNVVMLGDTVGTGSVWVGGGLNLALTTHLKALDRLATKAKIGLSPRESNFRIYEKTLQWATTAWHNAGADQLNR